MTTLALSVAEFDVLDIAIDYSDRLDWALVTGRTVRKRTVQRLVERGLMRELDHLVNLCDRDGFAREPERLRVGYRPTDAGRAAHAAYRAALPIGTAPKGEGR